MRLSKTKVLSVLLIGLFVGSGYVPIISSNEPVFGNTLYVGGIGSGNYSTIQQAINNAVSGDSIYVYDDSSTYHENVVVNKSIILTGEDKDTTLIDANGADYGVYIIADGVILTGFTIQNSSGADTAGIFIDAAETVITNNKIVNNSYYGIYITGSSPNSVIYHNDFVNNTQNAYDNSDSSVWDDDYPSGGNYWSDYTTSDDFHSRDQNQSGFDLIIDDPYNISGFGNEDRWPWTIPSGWEYPLFIPSLVLVQFNANVTDAEKNNTIEQYGTVVEEYLSLIDVYVLTINVTNQSEFDTMYMFSNNPLVKWADLDAYDEEENHLTEPNDECYPKQWHLNNFGINPGVPTGLIDADIDAPQAWEHLTDCSEDINHVDFVIAIIDTGVDLNHPDIVANLWVNPSEVPGNMALNGIDDDGDGLMDFLDPDFDGDSDPFTDDDDGNNIADDIHGADFSNVANPDGSPDDENGHGSHCAGIICAHGNNGIGVSGVCWRAQLMVLKGDTTRSVNYILDMKNRGINVNVISYSRGISTDVLVRKHHMTVANANNWLQNNRLPFYQNLINQLDNAGILFVCSAGNDGKDADAVGYIHLPHGAPNPNIIAVGASDNQDKLASFSNWGETSVDIISPGENIMSLAMHGRYVYDDTDNSNKVSIGDQRRTITPAVFPPGSTVAAGDGDMNNPLRIFNPDEKHDGIDNNYDNGEHIYRDVDAEDNVTAGDIRLSHVYINGMLRYNHRSTVIGTDADNGTAIVNFQGNERHRDNKGNFFIYDPGEYIYKDVDISGRVSVGDIRLTQVRSTRGSNTNIQAAQSDVGDCLYSFKAIERHDETVNVNGRYDPGETIYRDNDNPPDNVVSVGDQRLTQLDNNHKAGSFVNGGDPDIGRALAPFLASEKYSLVRYMSGTSMATPIVTGEVAHYWCHFPWLTHLQVKDWILRKVDPRKTVQNTVVSGRWNDGRLRMISGFDFGDAPDPFTVPGQYPTILWDELSHGASHEDMGEEWLGWDTSPEYDANVNWPWDVDAKTGTPNLLPGRNPTDPHPAYQGAGTPNLDWYEDGVSLPFIVFKGGTYEIKFNIRTENPFIHDVDDGRYDEYRIPVRDEKKIYINAYFDWNSDGDWDDGGEHLVKCPSKQCTWWGGPFMTCCYGIFWPMPFDNTYRKTIFTVPDNAADTIWVRVRLDYGENLGRSPWPRYDSTHPFDAVGEILSHTYAHAQFGEVEDYVFYTAEKVKIIGYPQYDDGDFSYVSSETPFEIVDFPEDLGTYIDNYYRLWFEDEWTDWMEYFDDDIFYLIGEGNHQVEFYGNFFETRTVFEETFEDGDELWTIQDHDGYGASWEWSNITPGWADSTIEGYFMVIDDNLSEIPNTDSLISPVLSCDQLNNPFLTFSGQFSSVGQEKLFVNISTDYGETWMNALVIAQEVPSKIDSWSIDLTDFVGNNLFIIKFTYVDENELGHGMIITDLGVNGELITYSPTYYNFHIVDDSPPIITDVLDEPELKTNQVPVTISCNVFDELCGVDSVNVNISGPEGFNQLNVSMSSKSYSYTEIFSVPGDYTYFIWVNDSLGHSSITETYTFQVFASPIANFTYYPTEPIVYESILFTDTSTDEDGFIINWTWNFGDGNFSFEQHPAYQYEVGGNYTVCLTVKDNDNVTNNTCDIIFIIMPEELIDINQSVFDRGFPIRHALDGDWAAAQSFIPTLDTLTSTEIYMRKFGTPEFNLTVELREDHPQGTLLDTLTFIPSEVPSDWEWFNLNFIDTSIIPGTDYFIVCPPAPSGVTTSFGYEWGYAFGNQYDDGAFWFTRDGGGLWRDLPTMYEFVFRTYGYD